MKRSPARKLLTGALQRLALNLFKDFSKLFVVFGLVFVLMLLHVSKTVEIPALNWLLQRPAKPISQKQSVPHAPANASQEPEPTADFPNLLP